MKVLVTDGTFKHTLAAVRTLGRLGYTVDVITYRPGASAAYSRYCHRSFIGPAPHQEDNYFNFLLELLKQNNYQVLMPIGSIPARVISQNREQVSLHTRFLLPSREHYEIAADKNKTIQYALQLNVPAPQTFWPKNMDDLALIAKNSCFPLVVKLPYDSGNVTYVNDSQELQAIAKQLISSQSATWPEFMVQEYVEGDGYGFFALFLEGECRAQFMHRRLLEYPITGGASVKAESVYDPCLAELGTHLLTGLKWNGVAMVEFKKDKTTQKYKLMEINPKFWGSLELAITSGVNFPDLYCRAALGEQIPPQPPYQVGLQFRWMIRESLFNTLAYPAALGSWIRDGLNSQVKKDIDWSDPLPHFCQLTAAIGELGIRIIRGKLRWPYGQPHSRNR